MKSRPIQLSQPEAFTAPGITVDREKGIISNVSIISGGPALGHGFDVDDVMLQQVVEGVSAKKSGVKSRLTHPEASGGIFGGGTDPIEVLVGRVRNARLEDGRVRGDVHLGTYAKTTPRGNLWDYLIAIAEEDPEMIGLSITFEPAEFHERPDQDPAGRIQNLFAVDFVGDPGANPTGLLSRGQDAASDHSLKGGIMNPKLRAHLESIGLKRDATKAEALAYWHALGGKRRVGADAIALQEGEEGEPAPAPAGGDVTPDLTPDTGESEEEFLARFEADEGMMAKYPDGADLIAKAKEIWTASTTAAGDTDIDVAPDPVAPAMSAKTPAQTLAADQERRDEILTLVEKHNVSLKWATGLCNRGVTVAMARELATAFEENAPVSIRVGADLNMTTLRAGIVDGIRLHSNQVLETPHERASEFRGLTVIDTFRHFLAAHGVTDAFHITRAELSRLMFDRKLLHRRYAGNVMLVQSTDDFDEILADVQNKTLQKAYEDAPTTWQIWARRVTNADFKDMKRTKLSESPNLVERTEGNPIQFGTITDTQETYALVEYAGGLLLTRRAIIDDDLDAFNRLPSLQGFAAARKEDDAAYAIITQNAAMADGVALFHADHGNLVDSGAAPSVAELAIAETLMMKQLGPKGLARLELRARYVLVPSTLYRLTQQLISSPVDPALDNATPNPFAGEGLVVVPSARLDDSSTVAWYLAADFNLIDTIEVAFLEGEPTPQLSEETDFDTDNRKYKVMHTVAAKAIDHRGLVRDDGTA